jgi:hypothetical protein
LASDVIGLKANPNWLPLTLVFGGPGPITAEPSQFRSMLIGYYYYYLFFKGGQTIAGFPCIQCLENTYFIDVFSTSFYKLGLF